MYSRNIANFIRLLVKDGTVVIDPEDEIIAGAGLTQSGQVLR